MVNGGNIFISLSGTSTPFAATRSNEIQVDSDKIPISSPNTGDWEEHILGKKKWVFSVNWLIGDADKIKKLLIVGQEYNISVYGRAGGTTTTLLQGRATCLSAKVTLTKGSIANGSFSFEGNGLLYIPVTNISISPSFLSLSVGDTQQLTATVLPSSASLQQLQWTSSDTSVATVDNEGNVTAVSQGNCTITCASMDGSSVTATCSIAVHNVLVSGIELTASSVSLIFNTMAYSPVLAIISPQNATNKHLVWTSDTPEVLFVEQEDGSDEYTVRSIALGGPFHLIATATDGSGESASCVVWVEQ